MSPDRKDDGGNGLRWAVWGVVGGLLVTVVLRAGFFKAAFLGTRVPGLFVAPFAMLVGGVVGWSAAKRTAAAPVTGVDAPAAPVDACSPTGTD